MEGRRAGGREPEREKERLREVPRERDGECSCVLLLL